MIANLCRPFSIPTNAWLLGKLMASLLIVGLTASHANGQKPDVFQDFSLPLPGSPRDSDAMSTVSLSKDAKIKLHVVCFLGTECPLAKVYGPRLERMSQTFGKRGVAFIGINSNIQDSMEELANYVVRHGITFPVGKDFDRSVALQSGATRTPEAFVIDRDGVIQYQGRIDDQYEPGLARSEATQHDLKDAIELLLAGKPVQNPRVEAVGCLIALPKEKPSNVSNITFCDQVIRVLQEHCIECHRDGEIGPFTLDQYDEVVGWADMSLEVIDQGRMPPWHASPEHGNFANSRFMPDSDKQVLRDWVDSGMPYGDAKQLPEMKKFTQGWRFGREPDLVLEMADKPFIVPAEGTVEYQYFVVDPGFTEDTWIRAAQVIPGDSSVVHHCICFTRPPDDGDFRDIGLLSAYVPGQVRGQLPSGFAQKVPAGSRIVFQMHYTPNGKVTEDNTRIGLLFEAAKNVTHEILALGGAEQEFEIPPGVANHTVEGSMGWFPKDGFLLSVMPHMHLRGKSFQFFIRTEEGGQQILDVPAYDFNWQHNYELSEPLALEKVSDLRFAAVFDNSESNPTNPDASEYVTWGDQTWQEMAVTFVSVARPLHQERKPAQKETKASKLARQKQQTDWKRIANEFAGGYIQRFDKNGDGELVSHELPDSVRMFSFRSLDHDRDSRITHEEIADERMKRLRRAQ
ncbi:MAG: redoxin domain-containing protein [Rubripirellula sp.]